MAKRKKVVRKAAKRSVARPAGMGTGRRMMAEPYSYKCDWKAKMVLGKLSAMAFILFVVTIWPAAMALVLSISPWWFLLAAVVFAALKMCGCWNK